MDAGVLWQTAGACAMVLDENTFHEND